MAKRNRTRRKRNSVKHDHWQVGNVIHIKPLKKECCRCKKLLLSGCHINGSTVWMCNRCLKVRARNINQDLLKLPGFGELLPKLGSK